MAYTLIIADDDAMIRKGLRCLIPWQELGFQLVEIFEDGNQVMDYLQNHAVDVILTDIRMHEISGLDIAQYVFEQSLFTRVVILSGYQEFEYAQRAIRYNVTEYLLKPIAIDDLRETFSRIRDMLDQERRKEGQKAQLEGDVTNLQERLDRLFLLDAYSGKLMQEGAFLHRLKINGYSLADLERKSILYELVCPPGKENVVISGMNLIVDGCSFYALKQQDDTLEGLLLENRPGNLQQLTTNTVEDRLFSLSGLPVKCDQISSFENLRQFTLFRSPESYENGGPAIQAEDYLREHYAEDITLNDVAARIFVNPAYLSRVFHQKTGRTFTEALSRIRLEAAQRLLKESNAAISEIARSCGYTDSKYFHKQFKRYVGMSPGKWRQTGTWKEDSND